MDGIQLHLETSGYCNAKCSFCPYNSDENKALPKGFMSWELSSKILEEAATLQPITEIAFSGLSEPLTDKLLERRIAFAKKLRPEWYIELYTNGTLLTPKRCDSLRDAGLDVLNVSLNAVTQAQHEKIMGLKGQFKKVCDSINYARATKGTMRVLVKAVVSDGGEDGLTLAQSYTFQDIWGITGVGDGVGCMVQSMNWAGKSRLIDGRVLDPNSTCHRALAQIAVSWAGHVNLCCLDPYGKYKFGDLTKQTIREVYNSTPYTEFREWHRDEQAARHPLCAVCTRV
jgi:radical SAM protein with 4Fe4S-binding SPASM domain